MLNPHIEIKNLSKVFHHRMTDIIQNKTTLNSDLKQDDKLVLDNINLSFNSGETIGIIGRNGAGKSTLLSIIAGISKQTDGEVIVNGKVTAVMTLGIGLREDLTGRDNIYIDGEIQGKTKKEIDSLIDKIILFSELEDFIDKPVKTYSTGMKSRLAFSMLVEIEPEILIIDEALSAGDVFFAKKASQKITEICEKGKIVIIVSHSMAAIQAMCNRCIWLEKGTITMDSTPEIVTEAYLNKIREEDDLIDIQIKRRDISTLADYANYQIQEINMKQIDSDYLQSTFYVQESFIAEIIINIQELCESVLLITIERLDGLLIFEQQYELEQLTIGKNLFQLSLNELIINKGHYQLKVELFEGIEKTNHFTRLFEIRNNDMPSGGSPLLNYPVDITLYQEEKLKCSDLIEQTVE